MKNKNSKTIIADRSSIPRGGMIRRTGPNSGSAIDRTTLATGWWGPLIQLRIIVAKIVTKKKFVIVPKEDNKRRIANWELNAPSLKKRTQSANFIVTKTTNKTIDAVSIRPNAGMIRRKGVNTGAVALKMNCDNGL